jgi:hypothetical protein
VEEILFYIDECTRLIPKINALPQKSDDKSLKNRAELLLVAMGYISDAFNKFIEYKTTNPKFNKLEIIRLDFDISALANRLYRGSRYLLDVYSKKGGTVERIFSKWYNKFILLTNTMLAIASRWDIERFINFYELDTEPQERAYPKRKPLLETPIFFMNRMNATKMGIHFDDGIMPKRIIFAVQPSSGKSFVVNVYSVISTMLHKIYYQTSGILRMSNNTSNAERFSTQIMNMIRDPKIAEIYPELKEYYPNNKCLIFERETIGEWKLQGLNPKIGASYYARGRESGINSIRIFVALIIDDLSDGVPQMNNDEEHKKMWTQYQIDMESRKEDDALPELIVGTMFNEYDVPNQIIRGLEEHRMLIDDDKYLCTRHTADFKTVVITIDCYDQKGESIAPKLISTEKLREKQENTKPYEFDLVYRQKRASREPRVFDISNLKLYDTLPDCACRVGKATLDPTRKSGSDWFVMPVCVDGNDGYWYFTSCICKQKSLGNLSDPENKFLDYVVQFIMDNNLVKLSIENNTSNTIGSLLDEKLRQKGYRLCTIDEFFSTSQKGAETKVQRILNQESVILEYIKFPMRKNYSANSDMGRFMDMFTNWDSKNNIGRRINPDDCCDAMAMFSKENILNTEQRISSITGIEKNKIFG